MEFRTTLMLLVVLLGVSGCIEIAQHTTSETLLPGEVAMFQEVAISVERYELRDEFVGNHDLTIFYNPEGHRYLYILVSAKNMGSKPVRLPSPYDISILYMDRPFRPEVKYHSEEMEMYEYNWFEEGPVEPGQEREGWVLFEVPETTSIENVRVLVEMPPYTHTAAWDLTP